MNVKKLKKVAIAAGVLILGGIGEGLGGNLFKKSFENGNDDEDYEGHVPTDEEIEQLIEECDYVNPKEEEREVTED